MKLHRNEQGLLRGDIEYDVGFPATVKPEITPVIYPCTNCAGLTLHVAIEQPTGVGIKLPFTRKPLASTGRDFGIVCNNCTCTTGISGREIIESLERRVVPRQICEGIDRFCSGMPGFVPAYTEGFVPFIMSVFDDDDDGVIAASTAVYSRGT